MVMRFVSAAEGAAQRACEPCTSISVGVVSELWAGGEAGDLEGPQADHVPSLGSVFPSVQ